MNQKVKGIKKVKKIRYGRLLILILIIIFFAFLLIKIFNKKITNIYIHNNKYIFTNKNSDSDFREQKIIDLAGLSNYPSTILTSSSKIKKKLIQNIYIKDAKVYKKNMIEVHIYVYENKPLFYNINTKKTVLEDGEVDKQFDVPILVNYVPDKVYEKLTKKFSLIDDSVLSHISEIRYEQNNVDKERFLCTMIDGNYVYITLNRIELINNYLDIIKEVGDKKGILYLDYGDHFVFE